MLPDKEAHAEWTRSASSAFGLWHNADGVVRFYVASLKGLDEGLHNNDRDGDALSSRFKCLVEFFLHGTTLNRSSHRVDEMF